MAYNDNGSVGSAGGGIGGTVSAGSVPYGTALDTLGNSGVSWAPSPAAMTVDGNIMPYTNLTRSVGSLTAQFLEIWTQYWSSSNNDRILNIPGAYIAYIVNGEFLASFRPQTGFQPETAGRKLGNNSSAATRWGAFFVAEDNSTTTPGTSGTAAAGSISGRVVLSAGNTTYTLTCNGISTSHKVFTNTSAGDIVAVRAVPTANTITFTLAAAAAANTTIEWFAISG